MDRSWADAPISMFSIPLVWALAMIPHVQKGLLAAKLKRFNNLAPRGVVNRMQNDADIDKETSRLAHRLESAHHNGMEAFPLWAVAITIGNVCGIENRNLNICSLLFLASRVLYNYLYATQRTQADAGMRTLAWFVGIGTSMYLLIRGPMIRGSWA